MNCIYNCNIWKAYLITSKINTLQVIKYQIEMANTKDINLKHLQISFRNNDLHFENILADILYTDTHQEVLILITDSQYHISRLDFN